MVLRSLVPAMDRTVPKPPWVREVSDVHVTTGAESGPQETGQAPQLHTLPSAAAMRGGVPQTQRGGGDDVVVIAPAPQRAFGTMPSADAANLAQSFRPTHPAFVALGGEVLEQSPPRLIRARFPADERWFTPFGVLSGGFVVAMFDSVVGALAHSIHPTRQHAVLETSARFFRSLRTGHLVVDGTVLRSGRTTATIECVAWDASNELCAKASATVMFVG